MLSGHIIKKIKLLKVYLVIYTVKRIICDFLVVFGVINLKIIKGEFKMSWERKALEDIILLLAEEDRKRNELLTILSDLRIEVDTNGTPYTVLSKVAEGMDYLPENLEALTEEENENRKKQLVGFFMEQIQKNYSNQD